MDHGNVRVSIEGIRAIVDRPFLHRKKRLAAAIVRWIE
jgi:hypothetical protein